VEEVASALTWGLLANYHPAYCRERLQQSGRQHREARTAVAFPWLIVHDPEEALQLLQALEPEQRLMLEGVGAVNAKWRSVARANKEAAGKRKRNWLAPTNASGRRCRRAKENKAQAPLFARGLLGLKCAVNRCALLRISGAASSVLPHRLACRQYSGAASIGGERCAGRGKRHRSGTTCACCST
jgi:hypothetical protein